MPVTPTDPPLLALVRRHRRHLWVGRTPPFEFPAVAPEPAANYRAGPDHHQAYDVVWSFETDLAALRPESLPLYLDELVRCLGEDGRLAVRFTESETFTVVHLKRFLGRHPFLDVAVEHEVPGRAAGDEWVTVFRVRRQFLPEYASADWTLAVLTRGDKVANVTAFLRSVREQDPDRRHELVVCGPPAAEYEPFGVRMHAKEYASGFADISAKKNDLAALAGRPNLLIVHDRYALDPGFFDGFARYGHDFDFATVPQRYHTGEEFPSYCTLSKRRHAFGWTAPIALSDYGRVYPLHYLNGGLLAVKTHTLRALRLNELLFWHQAEDVELAMWLQAHSLPPRVNPHSGATVLGLTPAYTRLIVPERADDSEEDPPPVPEPTPPAVTPPRPPVFRRLAAAALLALLLGQAVTLYLLLAGRGP